MALNNETSLMLAPSTKQKPFQNASSLFGCIYISLSQYVIVSTSLFVGDDVKEGDIQLVAGSYLWQGLVEIFLDGIWGRINYDGATSIDARVVCRQLGYNTYGNKYSNRAVHVHLR